MDKYKKTQKTSFWRKKRWWLMSGVAGIAVIALSIGVFISSQPEFINAAEADDVMAAQEGMDFGILIPTYIPKGFDRENVAIKVDTASGPSGEPVAELTYRNLGKKAAIFIRQWVPGNPDLENLVGSFPIETKWGKGYLMEQGKGTVIGTVWVMVGPLRIAVQSSNLDVVSKEQLVQIANTMGLASQDQVYTFKMDPLKIYGIAPPPPFEVQINSEGIQELNLTISPGGYSPIRFAVKKNIPVKVNFRALGDVGCGNTLIMPYGPNSAGAQLTPEKPLVVVEFTPETAGDWEFYCGTRCWRGVMTVRN